MTDAVIRARLLTRLLGLVLICFCMPKTLQGVATCFGPFRDSLGTGSDVRWHVEFFYSTIDLYILVRWLVQYGAPALGVAAGLLLLLRGWRRLERKFADVHIAA